MTDEADTRTRAELLRETYHREDGWHATNNAQIGSRPNPEQIMEELAKWSEALVAAQKEVRESDAELVEARQRNQNAHSELNHVTTNMDILKMALADVLEIPR